MGDSQEQLAVNLSQSEQVDSAPDQLMFNVNQIDYELFQQRMDEYGFSSKSAAARYFLNIGMKSIVENDPRNGDVTDESSSTSEDAESFGIEDSIPEGEENSLNIKNDEVIEAIEGDILKIIDSNPELNRDGLEVYK